MLTKTQTIAPDHAPADLVNRAELIERRASELEQQASQTAIQVRQSELQQLQQRRADRARMLRVVSDARHMEAEQSRKIWVRRGLVFAGCFLLGALLAQDKRPKAKLLATEPSPSINRRQLRWLLRKIRSRK